MGIAGTVACSGTDEATAADSRVLSETATLFTWALSAATSPSRSCRRRNNIFISSGLTAALASGVACCEIASALDNAVTIMKSNTQAVFRSILRHPQNCFSCYRQLSMFIQSFFALRKPGKPRWKPRGQKRRYLDVGFLHFRKHSGSACATAYGMRNF